jgi:Tyrosine phosphatase family
MFMMQVRFIFWLLILTLSANCKTQEKFKSLYDLKRDYNLGILINNSEYQIYRSERLGRKGIEDVVNSLEVLGYKRPKTIIYMNNVNYSFWMDHALEEYEMQNDLGYQFYHSYDYKMRTYLDGRNPLYPEEDIDDLESLPFWAKPSQTAIDLFGIKPDGKKDGGVDGFYRILEIILNPENQPVLFHCHAGIHRTGMIALAIRYLQGGKWTQKLKIPFPYQGLVVNNRAKQEYLIFNPAEPRIENFEFIDSISITNEFKKLSETYRNKLNN